MISARDVLDVLVALAALWGAGLSTAIYFADRRTKTPRLQVGLRIGPIDKPVDPPVLTVTVENRGAPEVIIDGWGLQLPRRQRLPVPWESGIGYVGMDLVKPKLRTMGHVGRVKIRGYYQDHTGKVYKSDPETLDLSE